MVERVSGSIGQDQVELNNAASEATLLRLLQAVQASGGSKAASATANLAGSAGVNANAVNQANSALSSLGVKATPLTQGFSTLFSHVAGGIPSVSGVLAGFTGLTGPLGIAITLFSMLAEFQEKNLETYKNITSVGANFGGSLTDLRMASTNAYVTLEQFGKIISENSLTLAKMGGTVNDGAKAFSMLSHDLISSDAGSALLALGYSTEEVNGSMLNYINATGGRTKQELSNTAAVTHATSEYMTELDKLTQFSGQSRKQQEEDQKKAAMNAAYQRALSNMTEDQKARAEAARAAAASSGIAGAQDLVMARIAGLPPLGEDAQKLAGRFGEATQGLYEMADQAKTTTGTMGGVENGFGKFNQGIATQVNRMGSTSDALATQGDKNATETSLYATKLRKSGNDTVEGTKKTFSEIANTQKQQQASQAATMTNANKNLQELGQAIMKVAGPIAAVLTPLFSILGAVVGGLTSIISFGVDVIEGALAPFQLMFGAIVDGISDTGKKLASALDPIIAPFRKLFQTETGNLGKLFGFLGDIGKFLLTMPFKILFGVLGAGIDVAAKGFKVVGEIVEAILYPFQSLSDWIGTFLDFMRDKLKSLNSFIPSVFSSDKEPKKMALGGVVTKATSLIAGEAGPEAIMPLDKLKDIIQTNFVSNIKDVTSNQTTDNANNKVGQEQSNSTIELFNTKLDVLNNTTKDLLRFMKDTAENTKRTHDATKALNGNLFAV